MSAIKTLIGHVLNFMQDRRGLVWFVLGCLAGHLTPVVVSSIL